MGDVRVLSTTAMKTVFEELAQPFATATGLRIDARYGPSVGIEKRIADGEAADVAVLTRAATDELTARGRILAASAVAVARSSLGVAVRKGAPRPDIASVAAFKRALLGANSVAVSRPVGGGLSGAHMAKVFEELGIAAAMAEKLRYGGGGAGLVGNVIERGEAEIGVQQIPELLAVSGVDLVGPLPSSLQCVTEFVAAIPASAQNAEAGRSLIAFLTSGDARTIAGAKGLEPC